LEAVQADVLAALQRDSARVGNQLIAHALIETTGSVLAAIIEAEPAARIDVTTKINGLHLHVATAGARPQ
jgi:hypothetical protein